MGTVTNLKNFKYKFQPFRINVLDDFERLHIANLSDENRYNYNPKNNYNSEDLLNSVSINVQFIHWPTDVSSDRVALETRFKTCI